MPLAARAFPGRCASGRPARRCVSCSTRRTSARRATSRRRPTRARAPRCAARERAPTCGARRAPRRDRGSRGRRARASRSLKPRVLVDDTPRGALAASASRPPGAPSRRARAPARRRTHIKARPRQRTTRSADGGRTCQVCRRMFPRRRGSTSASRAPGRSRGARRALRAAVGSAGRGSGARGKRGVRVRGRGPRRCRRGRGVPHGLRAPAPLLRRGHLGNAHAHLATVALQALTKAVERSARVS